MQHFDSDFAQRAIVRLRRVAPDATPQWGKLRGETLISHLIWALKHSMGRSTKVPFMGSWLTTRVFGPLIIRGIVRIPKNVTVPQSFADHGLELQEPGDIETLQALVEEYLALVQADELKPGVHPAFGEIGVDGWDRIHVYHFEHHLRQFGV
jgi:hypothetical protein